jgi:hypothetical protein
MKNPFEAPKPQAPQEDESVEVDLSDLNEEFGTGRKEFEPGEIAAKHAELGKAYADERAKEDRAFEKVSDAFFAGNPFLKSRFDKDPEALQRFRSGLKSLVITSRLVYHCDAEDLPGIPGFQKDLVKYSFDFEEKERLRKASGRKAA